MVKKGGKVFFSYAKSDREPARKIAHQLREAGFQVWDPDEEILPGADWSSELKMALDSAGAVVVFISPDAIASRWVSHEIEYALGAKHLVDASFQLWSTQLRMLLGYSTHLNLCGIKVRARRAGKSLSS